MGKSTGSTAGSPTTKRGWKALKWGTLSFFLVVALVPSEWLPAGVRSFIFDAADRKAAAKAAAEEQARSEIDLAKETKLAQTVLADFSDRMEKAAETVKEVYGDGPQYLHALRAASDCKTTVLTIMKNEEENLITAALAMRADWAPTLAYGRKLSGVPETKQTGQVKMTSWTFFDLITHHERVLVDFHSPNCPHCVKLAPEFEQAATAAASTGVVFATADVTVMRNIQDVYNITRLPSLFYFVRGVPHDVSKRLPAATKADLVEFAQQRQDSAVHEVDPTGVSPESLAEVFAEVGDGHQLVSVSLSPEKYDVVDDIAEYYRHQLVFIGTRQGTEEFLIFYRKVNGQLVPEPYSGSFDGPGEVRAWVESKLRDTKPEL